MRRAGLIRWLETIGFTARQVDGLIADGTIPKDRLRKELGRRAWYRRDSVEEALGLKEKSHPIQPS
jgi:hypothetical protein